MVPEQIRDALGEFSISHLDQYFGVWAIQEEPFQAAVARVGAMDLRAHVSVQQAAALPDGDGQNAKGYALAADGVAVVELIGPLMKYASSLSGGTSTVQARRALRLAAADADVRAILLRIDSPGGTVSGTGDLADDVRRAATVKPVWAYIEDLGASAAYWVASQATRVWANGSALVGSIGTFAVAYDSSRRAENLGLKVHVLRAGTMKGAGEPGTPITPEQLAEWQRLVDELNAMFLMAVGSGRRLSADRVAELADGRVHVGQAAVDLKLVDEIGSIDQVLGAMQRNTIRGARSAAQIPQTEGDSHVSEQSNTQPAAPPQSATLDDLKLFCPGADNDFFVAQLERKVTVDQARSNWAEEQNRRNEALRQEVAKNRAELEKRVVATGIDPLGVKKAAEGADSEPAGDAVAEFSALVTEKMKLLGIPRQRAVVAAAKARPDLHKAYLLATNDHRPAVQDLIEERFALAK